MGKHTPGPWRVGKFSDGSVMQIVTEVSSNKDANAYVFAEVSALLEDGEANARLIAAAPEILGKLKEIRSVMICVCKLNPYVGGPVPCNTCQIGAVIAKAEGREP